MKLAISGKGGVGKTTLAKLINRIYDADQGQILIDGTDVRDWNLESVRRGISIIEQDVFLFSRTIAENIAFGKPGADQSVIVSAAQKAQADGFIGEFKDGYQTVIGERGVTLSGGQRQADLRPARPGEVRERGGAADLVARRGDGGGLDERHAFPEALDVNAVGEREGLLDSFRRPLRSAPVQHLPRLHQSMHGAHGFLHRRLRIRPMAEIQVKIIHPKALQRLLTCFRHVLAAESLLQGAGRERTAEHYLGRHAVTVTVPAQAAQGFAHEIIVALPVNGDVVDHGGEEREGQLSSSCQV